MLAGRSLFLGFPAQAPRGFGRQSGIGNAGMDYWMRRDDCAILAFLYPRGPISYRTACGKLVEQSAERSARSIDGATSVKARRGEDINDKATARFFACHLVARAGS